MEYKGYNARIDGEDAGVLHGRVDGIEDIVTFAAQGLDALEHEFQISVDYYLGWCARDRVEPQRPHPPKANLVTYKGYTGVYEFEAQERVFHGHVTGISDLVTFVASRAEDVEYEFQQSVDFYLDHYARAGREPNRPPAHSLTS